ncbi:MAG: Stearoyl-CoA 9-desaturase [Chthoniobacter sp.]|jgi:stearoyl-CoA desaturase (delta-9 desaturase)|nr:Stearoyl-CoA 9-desaturase [Chthoniobacter sp.]
MFKNIPFERVNWVTSSFLIGTAFLSLTAVPLYIWKFGIDWFQIALFFVMFAACGFSITLGYHRLFSHLTFQAHWTVRLFVALFGAAAFENSILLWACEHRTHHKHVDEDEDPYDINKGLFHAHIGWLLFKLSPPPPFDNVTDLKKDRLVMWQHEYVQYIAAGIAFVLPAAIGFAYGGWVSALGAFLIAGVARVVFLQHCTFCINSLCHYIGKRPYSSTCSARDSWIMAVFTFGEGYHNFHHHFQHDYRNGVKPWQFDPTKWIIWTLSKLGLAEKLRTVPSEKILLAELGEAQRQMATRLESADLPAAARAYITSAYERLQATANQWAQLKSAQMEVSREMVAELRNEVRKAIASLKLREVADQQAGSVG